MLPFRWEDILSDINMLQLILLLLASVAVNGSLEAFAGVPSVGGTLETHL